MEFMNRAPLPGIPELARLAALLLLVMAGAACGHRVIEDRPPFVGISGMVLSDDRLSIAFRIANQNELAMNVKAIDITVTVDGMDLVHEDREVQLSIDANSAEELRVEELPAPATRDLLASLEAGEIMSLPFGLEGSVLTQESGTLRFEQKGHLYPVPGKPGAFRSAVTQAEELRRESAF